MGLVQYINVLERQIRELDKSHLPAMVLQPEEWEEYSKAKKMGRHGYLRSGATTSLGPTTAAEP